MLYSLESVFTLEVHEQYLCTTTSNQFWTLRRYLRKSRRSPSFSFTPPTVFSIGNQLRFISTSQWVDLIRLPGSPSSEPVSPHRWHSRAAVGCSPHLHHHLHTTEMMWTFNTHTHVLYTSCTAWKQRLHLKLYNNESLYREVSQTGEEQTTNKWL